MLAEQRCLNICFIYVGRGKYKNIKQQQIINDKDEAINELLKQTADSKQIEQMKKDVARAWSSRQKVEQNGLRFRQTHRNQYSESENEVQTKGWEEIIKEYQEQIKEIQDLSN